ncbi:TonB-dependent receptor, partial [Stenotrophomonas sp.]|uniref:TonB-dependent receptor plug domain-containing protein n=1 Tax=Stenotrophomonas sp. TaxID=69392 RepID=UPI002FC966E2
MKETPILAPRRRRLPLAVLSCLCLGAPAVALAEEPVATELDRVNVTGTRIARTGFVTPTPVTAINAEEIRATGAVNIGEVLTRLPQLTPTYTLGNSTRFIGTAGVGLLDLRGLGSARTLVLVNGRRHVGALPGSTSVDVNTIPVEWVERVEVITGGASAVYGADAVAGVVNFILKTSITGMEARAQTGIAGEGGFGRSFASASGGWDFADGRGNVAVALEYSTQDAYNRGARAIGRQHLVTVPNPGYDPSQPSSERNPQNVLAGPGGNHSISYGGTFNLGPFTPGNPATWGNRYQFNPDGSYRPQRYDGRVVSGNSCTDCDFADLNAVADLEPAFDRYSVNVMAGYDLNENHRLFFEGKYTRTEATSAAQPSFDSSLRIRADNPLLDPALRAQLQARGMDRLTLSRFNVDAGRRGENITRQTRRAVFGVEGRLGAGWDYEVALNHGQSTISTLFLNNRVNERWHAGMDTAVGPDGRIACRASLDPMAINPNTGALYDQSLIAGCIPFSVFGNGAISPEAAAWFNVNSPYKGTVRQDVFSASVSNPSLWSLPAGDMGVAAGVEYRREQSQERHDPLVTSGKTFLNALAADKGRYAVRELYLETSVPLLAELPGIHRLNLDLAGRVSDYSSIGRTTTWNAGLDWAILPSLRARASLAQAVRAPSIGELYGAQSENFATIADPCSVLPTNGNRPANAKDPALRAANCAALGIPADFIDGYSANRPGISGGNPDLKAEQGRTLSFGVIWQPAFLPGFGASADYWRINLTDAIDSVSAQTLATRCVDSPTGIDNRFCQQIGRAPAGGMVLANGTESPAHSIYRWIALEENLARSQREGIDIELDYRRAMGAGQLTTSLVASHLLQWRAWQFQDAPDDYVESVGGSGAPRWRGRYSLAYRHDSGWRGSWTSSYVHRNLRVSPDSYRSNPGQSSPIRNAGHVTHSMQVGYAIPGSGIDLYLGMDNV